jgi:hypothetical protein
VNEDLTAVRELTDEIASSRREPSLAASWLAIAERQRPRPHRTVVRRLVPVAAGLVVAMLAISGWYLVGPGGAGSDKALPADGQSVPVAQAWDAIIAAARSAGPIAVPDGSVVYVRLVGAGAQITNDGTPWTMRRQDRGEWFDPRGMVFRGYRDTGPVQQGDPAPSGPPAHPDLAHITPQWIVSLPTDVNALRDLLLAQSASSAGKWSNRYGLWEALAQLFHTSDLAIPVDVRASIYRVMAQENGLAANRTVVEGRDVYVISRVEGNGAQQLLFDPATGRCIGRRSLYLGDDPGVPADHLMSWSIWTQSVVAAVGDES